MGRGTTDTRIDLGQQAKVGSDAENKLQYIQEDLIRLENNIIAKWRMTKFSDSEGREQLFAQFYAIQELKREYELKVKQGKIAAHKLKELNNG